MSCLFIETVKTRAGRWLNDNAISYGQMLYRSRRAQTVLLAKIRIPYSQLRKKTSYVSFSDYFSSNYKGYYAQGKDRAKRRHQLPVFSRKKKQLLISHICIVPTTSWKKIRKEMISNSYFISRQTFYNIQIKNTCKRYVWRKNKQ